MFTRESQIQSSECDSSLRLSLPSLFRMFQDLSVMAVEDIGCGKKKTMDRGYLWVLERVRVKINRMPDYLEKVSFSTYPGNMLHFFYPRYYEMKSESGETLVEIASAWVLMGKKTRSIGTLDKTHVDIKGEEGPIRLSLMEPMVMEKLTHEVTREMRFSDIDMNGHVNNQRYIEFILDLHDSSFRKSHEISGLSIVFKSEAHESESMCLLYSDTNPESIKGMVSGTTAFEASVSYKI